MMSIDKSLELLSKASKFDIKKDSDGYTVEFKDERSFDNGLTHLSAYTEEGEWLFYIGGVYDSGRDYVPIDMQGLAELKAFCELLGCDAE